MAFFNEAEWAKSLREHIAAHDKKVAEDLRVMAAADPTFNGFRHFCFIWTGARMRAHETGRAVAAEAWMLLSDETAAPPA